MAEPRHFSGWHPALFAGIVAIICAAVATLLIHDRWSRPDVKPAEVASTTTTGEAARSAGAQVLRTDPKLSVEPKPASPGPVQPANPN